MRVPLSPYSVGEFASMVWRRFSAPSSRPASLDRDLVFRDAPAPSTIGFVGDICPLFGRKAQFGPALQEFLADCEVVVGNFEGIFSDRPWKPFLMKHSRDIFPALAQIRPLDQWVVSIANNHATDFGTADLNHTIRLLDRHGVRWLGTTSRPRLQLADDVTLTAWTWWLNRPGDGVARRDPGAPSMPGLHIATPHWGYEHERQPRPDQSVPDQYTLTVGHHTHLPQPFEHVGTGQLVAWSLGNFITGKRLPVLGEGALLKVDVARTGGATPNIARCRYREIDLDRNRRQCHVRLRHRQPPKPSRVPSDTGAPAE